MGLRDRSCSEFATTVRNCNGLAPRTCRNRRWQKLARRNSARTAAPDTVQAAQRLERGDTWSAAMQFSGRSKLPNRQLPTSQQRFVEVKRRQMGRGRKTAQFSRGKKNQYLKAENDGKKRNKHPRLLLTFFLIGREMHFFPKNVPKCRRKFCTFFDGFVGGNRLSPPANGFGSFGSAGARLAWAGFNEAVGKPPLSLPQLQPSLLPLMSTLPPSSSSRQLSSLQLTLRHLTSRHLTSAQLTSRQLSSRHVSSARVTSAQLTSRHVSSAHVTSAGVGSARASSAHVSSLSSRHVSSAHGTSAQLTSRRLSCCSRHVGSAHVTSA